MTIKLVETEPSGEAQWIKILDFASDHPEFAKGFEAGTLFRTLQTSKKGLGSEDNPLKISTSNLAMYEGMGECFHMELHQKPTEVSEWTSVWFTKKKTDLSVV